MERFLTKQTILSYIKNEKLSEIIDNYAATIDGGYVFYYYNEDVIKVNSAETFRDWLFCILEAGWDYYFGYFVYNFDAWDYLQENSIADFSDAISEGYTDIVGIANYYFFENAVAEIDEAAAELIKSYDEIANDWLYD